MATVLENAVPTQITTGLYRLDFPVPADGELGTWRAHFSSTGYQGDVYFEVIAAPSAAGTLAAEGGPRELQRDVGGTITVSIDVDATSDVLVTIRNGAGEIVVENAEASKGPDTTGVYDYQVSGAQVPEVDQYTLDWLAVVNGDAKLYRTGFEVVGGFLFAPRPGPARAGRPSASGRRCPSVDPVRGWRSSCRHLVERQGLRVGVGVVADRHHPVKPVQLCSPPVDIHRDDVAWLDDSDGRLRVVVDRDGR
jgi:hypothetical protein